jgi:sugar phosphate isomerase/epimerase
MRISIWSYFLEGLTPEEMVNTFVDNGWRNAELSSEHGHDLIARGDPATTGAAFKTYADNHNFSFPQAHFDLSADLAQPAGSPERDAVLDNMKRWCDLFAELDVRAAVLHPGGERLWKLGIEREETIKYSAEVLQVLAQYVEGTPITLCLENIWHHEDTMHLVDTIDSPRLATCMDTGHLNLTGSHWSEYIKWAGKRLKAIHITDNLGTTDNHILPYGPGKINWDGFGQALKDVDYQGLFNFEVGGESSNHPLDIRLKKLASIKELAKVMIDE